MERRILPLLWVLVLGVSIALPGHAQAGPAGQSEGQAKILGGRKAGIGDWPWAVALVHGGMENAYRGQFCGGSLIAERWVLTAAHCLTDKAGNLKYGPGDVHVINGRTDLNAGDGDRIAVGGYVVHPLYNPDTDDNDVALLHLERIPNSETIWRSITLIQGGDPAGLTGGGQPSWVVGWGALGPSGPYPSHLYQAQIPLVDQAELIAAYPPPYFNITPNMIGAGPGDGSVDTCQGDSGGPLMVRDSGGNYILAGVTSWGLQCGTPGVYGVYSRLANYCDWIKGATGVGDCGDSDGGGGCTVSGRGFAAEWLLLAAFLAWMHARGRCRYFHQSTGSWTSLRALFWKSR